MLERCEVKFHVAQRYPSFLTKGMPLVGCLGYRRHMICDFVFIECLSIYIAHLHIC